MHAVRVPLRLHRSQMFHHYSIWLSSIINSSCQALFFDLQINPRNLRRKIFNSFLFDFFGIHIFSFYTFTSRACTFLSLRSRRPTSKRNALFRFRSRHRALKYFFQNIHNSIRILYLNNLVWSPSLSSCFYETNPRRFLPCNTSGNISPIQNIQSIEHVQS